ncbi:MAG: hypothetical protein HY741_19135 [Chloroflexi bacterium]|nr:hypothetical protein [Chloroflexota bacterium]
MTTPYQAGYRLPFPCLHIFLFNDTGRLGPLRALVDTGADATIVPIDFLLRVRAEESGWAGLHPFMGETKRVQKYLIDIQVDTWVLPGIYVVADPTGQELILGRDVLNKLPLFLDGPEQQTDLLDDAAVKRLRARRKT